MLCVLSGNFSLAINATSILAPTLANLTAANCSWTCDTLQPVDCVVSWLAEVKERSDEIDRHIEQAEQAAQQFRQQLREHEETSDRLRRKVMEAQLVAKLLEEEQEKSNRQEQTAKLEEVFSKFRALEAQLEDEYQGINPVEEIVNKIRAIGTLWNILVLLLKVYFCLWCLHWSFVLFLMWLDPPKFGGPWMSNTGQ